jgi:hypothetical protein
MAIQARLEIQPAWMQEVLNSYATDPETQAKLTQLAISSPDEHGYEPLRTIEAPLHCSIGGSRVRGQHCQVARYTPLNHF